MDDKISAYLLAENPEERDYLWLSFDLDRENVRCPSHCNTHIAFSITLDMFEAMKKRIISSKATFFKENTSAGESLYFLDPDNISLKSTLVIGKSVLSLKNRILGLGKMLNGL